MIETDHSGLRRRLEELRGRLNGVFAPDTSATPWGAPPYTRKSEGHCAIVAMLLHDLVGGEFVSSVVNGTSHWFNRIINDGVWVDVDLTGDQFSGDPVRIGEPGTLWKETRARSAFDLNQETRRRYALLRSRLEAR